MIPFIFTARTQAKSSTIRVLILIGVMSGALGSVAVRSPGQTVSNDTPDTSTPIMIQPLRLGYLGVGLEVALPVAAFTELGAFLERDEAVRSAMSREGRRGVSAYPIDSFQEMLDRLNLREFDLAYCPAKILVEQTGGYVPILQLRPAAAIADTSMSRMTAWRGVIIGSRQADLFKGRKPPSSDALGDYLSTHRMAFPSAHSAVGYIYPLLTMQRRFNVSQPAGFIFLGTSQEVARAVINGLIPLGACEEGALHEVLQELPYGNRPPWKPEDVVQIIARTPPVPTDPIIVRGELAPERSALGQALRDALRRYHDRSADLPKVGESSPANFDQLREDLFLLRSRISLP
ncbi:MAG: hypothetical protein Kow0059_10380 [Candidatus Sumerlaeia bacterium]